MSIPNPPAGRSDRATISSAIWRRARSRKSEWRIGTEHEKFVYDLRPTSPFPMREPGIRALLEGMRRFGWEPVMEGDNIIGLSQNGAAISLEPGGQFELSGAPLKSVHETCAEVNTHQQQVREVGRRARRRRHRAGLCADMADATKSVGCPSAATRSCGATCRKVGGYGLEMMFRTCTVQVNLDFASEADMVKKFRVGLALQPVATALFANSPFREGKPNGFLSYRSHIWTDVDNDRAGMLPFVFEDGLGFERYVDYVLDVPMYFVYREGSYIDVAGKSFRDFLAGKIPEVKGIEPTMADWADHLTTIFPEVRLKKFLEMRGADGGQWRRICGLPALWVGLFTIRLRSMRHGIWSRTGRRKNARPCATRFRGSPSRRRSATPGCGSSPTACSKFRPRASSAAPRKMPAA